MKTPKKILRWILGITMTLAGIYHFVNPSVYLRIMPTYLPAHLFLIYLSGAFEIALGVLLLIPKFSRVAAYGLIALFIAVFPANIFMAMNIKLFPTINPLLIYLRLPLQFVLIACAYWLTRLKNLDKDGGN